MSNLKLADQAPSPGLRSRVLRLRETEQITGLCNMQLWRMERAGNFPRRFKLNPDAGPKGAVGHDYEEVMAWVEQRRASRKG